MISTMEDDEECITGLCLGLGTGGNHNNNNNNVPKKEKQKVKKPIVANSLDLPFELCPDQEDHDESSDNKPEIIFSLHHRNDDHHHPNSDDSTKSKNGIRKKLRLTKDQLAMLESSFKLHTTLNSAQKQALADQLNLKARQIEVWFQNRRARTKLKQTEVDCELLKRRCQSLSDENRRLKKEVQELRALKVAKSPLYIQLSKAATLTSTATTCSSCDKLVVKPDPTIIE